MEVVFFNNCKYVVEICLGSEGRISKIQPCSYITVLSEENREITFSIHRDKKSYKNKGKYFIEISTQYSIVNYNEGKVIILTCEKDQINRNIYFERLNVEIDAQTIMPHTYSVFGEREIMSVFNKSWITEFFVTDPLMHLFGKEGLLFILIGFYLSFNFGFVALLIYILFIYLFLVGVDLLMEKIWKKIFKKTFDIDDEKTEFYNYLTNDFIVHFYTNRR